MYVSPWSVFLTLVASSALAAERPPPPPLFMEPFLSDVGGWALGFNPKLEGCVAARQFEDQTSFWTGYSAEGPTSFPYIGFTNASWNIEPGKTYTLRVVLRGVRGGNIVLHGDFTGIASRESGFVGSINHTNMEDIAAADSVELTRDGHALSDLDLEGSRNAITELIRCQNQAPQLVAAAKDRERTEATASGTGFFVAEGGYILTNEHVAGRCDELDVKLPDGELREATLVEADSENDLALLTTVKGGATVASFAHLARLGEAAYAFGYPLAGLLSSSGSFTGGNVNSLEGIGDDGRMLQISTPIQPGNSGGPLLDASGNVIGVVRSKANAIAIASITSDISQNVNFAVKPEVAAGFLRSVGIEPTMAGNTATLDVTDLAQKARSMSVKVICHAPREQEAKPAVVAQGAHRQASASEEDATYRVPRDTAGGILNIRRGPGQRHDVIVAVPAGTGGIRKSDCRPGDDGKSRHPWCRVQWKRFSGWASSCCLVSE